jgi:hypothetical protein
LLILRQAQDEVVGAGWRTNSTYLILSLSKDGQRALTGVKLDSRFRGTPWVWQGGGTTAYVNPAQVGIQFGAMAVWAPKVGRLFYRLAVAVSNRGARIGRYRALPMVRGSASPRTSP